ncbi:MAG: ribonuclease HI family protein [Candidatus Omnitrophica bacterium]|nr:ribonuclease HI family protein [Candidatus Omnitrophota bacterium]
MIKIYIDGASRGNPGPCGVGYLICEDDKVVKRESIALGEQTNNFAEYMALIFALVDSAALGYSSCEVYSDSQLLCEQLNGNYKVKNKNIYPLFILANRLIKNFKEFRISHIRREKNSQADELAKQATDH